LFLKVKGETMRMPRPWIQLFSPILFVLILTGLAPADNGKKEVLPFGAMSGIIQGTFEPGKILLSSNDKIVISLNQGYRAKPGDFLEIYQPLDSERQKDGQAFYRKVGLGIIIEKIDEQHAVCIIDSSVKEISVGDLVRVVNPW
jgi:hypothetical protein